MRERIDMLKNTYGVSIDLLVDEKVKKLKLNMKQRKDIYWLLKGGVTNTTRTGAGNIKAHLALEKSTFVYTLEFDNSNMDMQQFNNLVQRQELANKLKDVNGILKERSVIEVKVPV
jgi:hypothetical protein